MAEATTKAKYVLIGGGLASATAAKTIRENDPDGSIVIICGERRLPYHRPPLSKEYLRGEADFSHAEVASEAEWLAQNIELRLGIRAEKVDATAKTVTLSDTTTLAYEKLLLATGASAKSLSPDDIPGANAPNILKLRTADDADILKAYVRPDATALVLGAGYIGMEAGAVFRQRGAEVTILDTAPLPWGRNTSPAFGTFLKKYYESQGVQFLLEDGAAEFIKGPDGAVISVKTKSGATLPCDFVLAGVGAKLNLELAQTIAGLDVDEKEGVRVNEFLETGVPDIYAAGDIARFEDKVLGKSWHIEHWQNAEWHGQIAGANMSGKRVACDHIPYFFSDEFDLHMTLRGDPQGGKSSFTIGSMEPDTGRFLELYLREDGTLAMGLLISKAEEETATSDLLERLIRAKTQIAPYKEALISGEKQLAEIAIV